MTDYVIDANILVSMLISGKASYRYLVEHFNFILPDFSLIEIEKYKATILEKSRLKESQFNQFTYQLFSKLIFLPSLILTNEAKEKAFELTSSIDSKDMAYVSLSLQLDLILLTRDKQLVSGLKKKGFRKVMLFEDFLKSI